MDWRTILVFGAIVIMLGAVSMSAYAVVTVAPGFVASANQLEFEQRQAYATTDQTVGYVIAEVT